MRTYTIEEYNRAHELRAQGLTFPQVSEASGIPFGVLRGWFHRGYRPRHSQACAALPEYRESPARYVTPERESAYAYTLGQYLGDGLIKTKTRDWQLCIYSDRRYEGLNQFTERQLARLFPESKVRRRAQKGCWEIVVGNALLPYLFPQHGAGKKWAREIKLTQWQTEILDRHPHAFLLGLIYSDGSIYPGTSGSLVYNFTQKSADIMAIFLRYARAVGLPDKTPRLDWHGKASGVNYTHANDRAILSRFVKRKQDVTADDHFEPCEESILSRQNVKAAA